MMDPSSVQHGGVEHVLHQHGDLGSVDPHLLSLPSVHSHHVLAQQVPLGGYMHPAHSLPMPPPVHIVPNPISQVSLTGSPYVHPGLMQEQTEKYGPLLFHKDDQGLYTCFFTGCGKKLKANFSRHVAKHEMDGDKMDPNLATQIQTSSASKNLGTTKVSLHFYLVLFPVKSYIIILTTIHICSHPTHQEWWGTSAEQPVTEFYKRCSKCKKCYIRLQQESKRQRLSLEGLNNSPMAPPVMMQPQYGGDMFPMGHVNTLPMLDHHLKRDDIDDEQGPSKRMRIEESASLMASLQELTYKHFKEMAELTARHSAHSRKLIAENTAVRMAAELRHTKDKEDLEVKFKNQWDQFRFKCLREREDLYQAQLGALNRELNGATIPVRPCRLCTKRIYSTFLYQCNLCNEEACIRCQAVMVCGVCGTKSCENCTIKHNWLIWCNRCHKTFCSNHRSISDDICPSCDAQKGVDMMMHSQHLTQHLPHDLDHSQHLHHSHSDYDHDLPLHHHSSHHHSEELMGQHLKFEDLDNPHHPHSHSHELSNQHYDSHLHHDHHHLQHEHMQHLHEHLQHEHMQHHLQHGHDDHHHHYQDQQYDLQHLPPHDHIPSDLSEHHHHHQQQYEQNYQDQQDYHHEQSIHHDQQSEQELEHQQHEQSQQNYEQQNYQEQQDQASPSQNGVEQQNNQGDQHGQESEQQNEEQGNQATSHNDGEESQQYLQQSEQEQQMINEQDQQQTSPESHENKYDDLPPQSSQTAHKASLIR